MRLLVTRPDEDAGPLMAVLEAMGHQAFHMPLMVIRYLDAEIPVRDWQALLVTSANGVRALAARGAVARLAAVPVMAVGEASAAAARAAGFQSVTASGGDVGRLVETVGGQLRADGGPLLHLAGSVLAGDLKGLLEERGYGVERVVLYEAEVASSLPEVGRGLVTGGGVDGVLFFSPRTAVTFAGLMRDEGLGVHLARLSAFCLSQAVADALKTSGFGQVLVSDAPTQEALLALTMR
mgnify:CR=1 FL=1|tara:strand:- start:1907 stop:2617 length:711 start_codon:yes stop_codon:yes gene_type:complete